MLVCVCLIPRPIAEGLRTRLCVYVCNVIEISVVDNDIHAINILYLSVRGMVKTASNKSVTQSRYAQFLLCLFQRQLYIMALLHIRSQAEGGETNEIRRTMKASRIQRDVVCIKSCTYIHTN